MPPSHSSLSDTDEGREGRYLRESIASVRLHAQRLRRALDADRLDEAVKIAADVAAELRSIAAAELSPKLYYDVYLSVGAELRVLENYAMESARRGAPVLELYERVQETPLVLPRLYLLITAGSVYIKSQQAAAKDVLRDLVEMCAGVQHPQRGLFLRAYLSQMMKDKLPDVLSEDEHDEDSNDISAGTVHDSISFVIRNFTEMNRLWVRMEREASTRDIEVLEKERLELRILVGSNIATLGRLVGSNLDLYKTEVLPAIVEQIVKCNDSIAQEYLADCIAQVFPDDFHLQTLEEFMHMCKDLKKGVNMRIILSSIIQRLSRFVSSSSEAKHAAIQTGAFTVFRDKLPAVAKHQGSSLNLTDRLRIHVELMNFTLCSEPNRTDYVDDVLGFTVHDMQKFLGSTYDHGKKSKSFRKISTTYKPLITDDELLALDVLTKPLDKFKSVGSVLKLENFVVLQNFLSYENQKALAARLLLSAGGYSKCIHNVNTLKKLFRYVAPLVLEKRVGSDAEAEGTGGDGMYQKFDMSTITYHHEYLLALMPVGSSTAPQLESSQSLSADTSAISEEDTEQFEKNQELVARIVYLCEDENIGEALSLYIVLRQELIRGGGKRLSITLPSLMFASLRLALRCSKTNCDGDLVERILSFAAESVELLPDSSALLALRLRLHIAGTAASLGGVSRFVYDNISSGFVAYEQHITTSRDQHKALQQIIATMGFVRDALPEDSFEALANRAIKHATRSLTRSDQCVLLCMCAKVAPKSMKGSPISCLMKAEEAAECCVNAAERVLLMLDVASCAAQVHETKMANVCEGQFLGELMKKVREIMSSKQNKGSALGKVVAIRYGKLVGYLKQRLDVFEGLDGSEL
ncbi:Vacuolar protein sorting-associated protein 35B [Gracilariopsis chorda]|uniref:Vacuolar protein sorting-associated protein 35 n=1 Tax=Gracilariopsis chorda TaxID=448386 RepID=A0A2V3II67_9FLOR|nr:Vacuolar protein sorting-associated protein 35B [Gracilariopsis chorda]|eukprot:PXF41784.1 Vacuolar protein sorting-associated protein 35B [Gracilariopsis chorda]